MAQINSFGLLNVSFKNKAQQTIHLGNFMLSPKSHSAMIVAENQTGKTSILTIIDSLFHRASNNRLQNNRKLSYYFKTNTKTPALIFIDFTNATDSDQHTLLAQWVNYNNLETHDEAKLLSRYGLVLNYRTQAQSLLDNSYNHPLQDDDWSLLDKLGLVSYDKKLHAYFPCLIKHVKSNVNANITKLVDGVSADIQFCGTINDANMAAYFDAIKASTHIDHQAWNSTISKILLTEGGISNLFTNIKITDLINKQIFPEVLQHTDNLKTYDTLVDDFKDLTQYRINHNDNLARIDKIKATLAKLNTLRESNYSVSLANLIKQGQNICGLKAFLLNEKQQIATDIVDLTNKKADLTKQRLDARYNILQLQQENCEKEYHALQQKQDQLKTKLAAFQRNFCNKAIIAYQSDQQLLDETIRDWNRQEQELRDSTNSSWHDKKQRLQRHLNKAGVQLKDYYARQISQNQEKLNNNSSSLSQKKAQIVALQKQVAELNSQHMRLEIALGTLNNQIVDWQKELAQLPNTNFEQIIADNIVKIKRLQKSNAELAKAYAELAEKQKELVNNKSYDSKKTKAASKKQIFAKDLKQKQAALKRVTVIAQAVQKYNAQVDANAKAALINALDQIKTDLTNEIQLLRDNISQLKQNLNLLEHGQLFALPASFGQFLKKYHLSYQTGFNYLKQLNINNQKALLVKMPLLPNAILVDKIAFKTIKAKFKDALTMPLLIINSDDLSQIQAYGSNYQWQFNFDLTTINNSDQKIAELNSDITKLNEKCVQKEKQLEQINDERDFIKFHFVNKADLAKLQTKIETLSNDLAAYEQAITNQQRQINNCISQKEQMQNQQRDQAALIKQYEQNNADCQHYLKIQQKCQIDQDEIKTKRKQLAKLQIEIDQDNSQINDLELAINELVADKPKLEVELNEAKQKYLQYERYDLTIAFKAIKTIQAARVEANYQAWQNELANKEQDLQAQLVKIDNGRKNARNKFDTDYRTLTFALKNIQINIDNIDFKQDISNSIKDVLTISKIVDLIGSQRAESKFASINKQLSDTKHTLNDSQTQLSEIKQNIADFMQEQSDFDLTAYVKTFDTTVAAKNAIKQIKQAINQTTDKLHEFKSCVIVLDGMKQLKDDDLDVATYLFNAHKQGLVAPSDNMLKSFEKYRDQLSDQLNVFNKAKRNLAKKTQRDIDSAFAANSDNSNIRDNNNALNAGLHEDLESLVPAKLLNLEPANMDYMKTIEAIIELNETQKLNLKSFESTYDSLLHNCGQILVNIAKLLHSGLNDLQRASKVHLDNMQADQESFLIKFATHTGLEDIDQDNICNQIEAVSEELAERAIANSSKNDVDFDLKKLAKQTLSYNAIYGWAYEPIENVQLKIINLDKLNTDGTIEYLSWNDSLRSGDSGGAWAIDSLILLIAFMRYQSSTIGTNSRTYRGETGNVLLVDNLFTSANSQDILKPTLDFAKMAHIQIITFTDHENTNLLDSVEQGNAMVNMAKQVAYFNMDKQVLPDGQNVQLLVTNNTQINYTDRMVD